MRTLPQAHLFDKLSSVCHLSASVTLDRLSARKTHLKALCEGLVRPREDRLSPSLFLTGDPLRPLLRARRGTRTVSYHLSTRRLG